jgi:hypothetical protein
LQPGGEGSLSRELLDELTILRMQTELGEPRTSGNYLLLISPKDLAKLKSVAAIFRHSLRCIRDQSEDGRFYNIMKARDAASAMAKGFKKVRELAEAALTDDLERHPEAWDASLLPMGQVNQRKPSIHERAMDFYAQRGLLS